MTPTKTQPYRPKEAAVRIVTATALFDGHDASINIMRRILQASGVEVIHLGHNRSVDEIVAAVAQEDAQGVAVTSYQGGHIEFFKYLRERLDARGLEHVRVYGGGGGTIIPSEIEDLETAGIDRIFSPEDGRRQGLQGMINEVIEGCDFAVADRMVSVNGAFQPLARAITRLESDLDASAGESGSTIRTMAPVVGITGTGGAGKSSLTDELLRRFLADFDDQRVAVVCADPTRKRTGGALLGDRIRFNSLDPHRIFFRSVATRTARGEVSEAIHPIVDLLKRSFDLVIVETAGIGQGDSAIVDLCDFSIYVMTSEFGAPSQLEKIDMLDFADTVVINKFSRRGSEDALRDVRQQVRRNRELFDQPIEDLPVFGTNAAHFNDPGVNSLYQHLIEQLDERFELDWRSGFPPTSSKVTTATTPLIGRGRERYLSEIAESCRQHRSWAEEQSHLAHRIEALGIALETLGLETSFDWSVSPAVPTNDETGARLTKQREKAFEQLSPDNAAILRSWSNWEENYRSVEFRYSVRDREVRVANFVTTLSGTAVPKVALPRFVSAADRLSWRLRENVPGEFPFTAGVFPFKRQQEDPTRMFAGEGTSERTNARFHYLASAQPAKRLSTAFDSLTLYGQDPGTRPDIYGKIGESGVSIFTVEEAERLYAGFDLCDPTTSVSMTINGPAPTVLAFFFNVAIRQHCRRFLRSEGRLDISADEVLHPESRRGSSWEETRSLLSDEEYRELSTRALQQVRGTVQADILKEDQGQNTCIFSTEFALRVMGDIQQLFVEHSIRNFYSVSISGYHIAEAGANPIHQLAFTLANGFTYVEYYLSRGMDIDAIAPSLSFFFSNGMDPEYSVIGRVARRIWAVAMKHRYGASKRGQKLKYHIQTSGRSLHAQEIQFNDIRTTLQALLATYDNAQSLHTNAYDEAITTPTEESVRRALAIQLIINKEFGLVECENATQGSFIIEELTDLVEEAVLVEFDRLTERGGVLGAMELQYQRGEIQNDSLIYESKKHSGELPIVGVNCFLPDPDAVEDEAQESIPLTRASEEEKRSCIDRLSAFHEQHRDRSDAALTALKQVALADGNVFRELLSTVTTCSLGQITEALFEVGGQYRRNL